MQFFVHSDFEQTKNQGLCWSIVFSRFDRLDSLGSSEIGFQLRYRNDPLASVVFKAYASLTMTTMTSMRNWNSSMQTFIFRIRKE